MREQKLEKRNVFKAVAVLGYDEYGFVSQTRSIHIACHTEEEALRIFKQLYPGKKLYKLEGSTHHPLVWIRTNAPFSG